MEIPDWEALCHLIEADDCKHLYPSYALESQMVMELDNLRKLPGTLILVLVATLCACRNAPSANIQGTWKLTAVGGEAPVTAAIKSWQIHFEQGKWSFSGEMTGQYEGTRLSGSGIWSLSGDELEYTAGNNKGVTRVHVNRNSLIFDADPVIRLDGKQSIRTEYRRSDSE